MSPSLAAVASASSAVSGGSYGASYGLVGAGTCRASAAGGWACHCGRERGARRSHQRRASGDRCRDLLHLLLRHRNHRLLLLLELLLLELLLLGRVLLGLLLLELLLMELLLLELLLLELLLVELLLVELLLLALLLLNVRFGLPLHLAPSSTWLDR